MKKILMFIVSIMAIIGMSIKLPPVLAKGYETKLYIEGEHNYIYDTTCVPSGGDTVVLCSSTRARELFKSYPVLSVVYKTNQSVEQILAEYNLRIHFKEEVEGIVNYFGFSPQIAFRELDMRGEVVNMQVAKRQNDVLLGFPIIYTDY